MTLDLKAIFAGVGTSMPIEYEMDMSDVDFSGDFPLKSPVKISGSVSNRASMVELRLEINYVFSAPCHRCGVDFDAPYSLVLERTLAVSVESEENDTIIAVPGMTLDLDELVFSEVYMDLPTKHLCSEDCKGICSKCGKNLNEGKCDCPEKEIDPRLQALADLLKN